MNKHQPKETEDFQALDQRDEEQIVRELKGELLDKYAYSFKRGGRRIVGISYAGVKAAVRKMGNIDVDDFTVEEKDDIWIAHCKAHDHTSNVSLYGGAQQAKTDRNGQDDQFAYAKAVSKAQRNALRNVIPEAIIQTVIGQQLDQQEGKQNSPKSKSSNSETQERKTLMSKVFAKANHKTTLGDFSKDDFAEYCYETFEVDSRKNLTRKQLEQLNRALDDGTLLNWIENRRLKASGSTPVEPEKIEENNELFNTAENFSEAYKIAVKELAKLYKDRLEESEIRKDIIQFLQTAYVRHDVPTGAETLHDLLEIKGRDELESAPRSELKQLHAAAFAIKATGFLPEAFDNEEQQEIDPPDSKKPEFNKKDLLRKITIKARKVASARNEKSFVVIDRIAKKYDLDSLVDTSEQQLQSILYDLESEYEEVK